MTDDIRDDEFTTDDPIPEGEDVGEDPMPKEDDPAIGHEPTTKE